MASKGFLTQLVDATNDQVMRNFVLFQTIFLLPYIITDIIIISTTSDICYLANFACIPNDPTCYYFGILTLGQWLFMDGYIKMAVYVTIVFLFILHTEIHCKTIMVALTGNIIRFFYIFDLAWTIVGSVLFWGTNEGFDGPTYTYCSNPQQGYIFYLLIYSYIIIPINIFIGGFRTGKITQVQSGRQRSNTQLAQRLTNQ